MQGRQMGWSSSLNLERQSPTGMFVFFRVGIWLLLSVML